MAGAGGRHRSVGSSDAVGIARSVLWVLAMAAAAPEYPKALPGVEACSVLPEPVARDDHRRAVAGQGGYRPVAAALA